MHTWEVKSPKMTGFLLHAYKKERAVCIQDPPQKKAHTSLKEWNIPNLQGLHFFFRPAKKEASHREDTALGLELAAGPLPPGLDSRARRPRWRWRRPALRRGASARRGVGGAELRVDKMSGGRASLTSCVQLGFSHFWLGPF